MYDVPSMCSTANRKTNSFKDNVKVPNSKMGNSPQKHTHTQQQQHNNPKNKLNKKAQQNTKTLTKNWEDKDSKDLGPFTFFF